MKKNYKILFVILIAAGVIGCVKAPHGFLSSQIRYRDNPIQVQRGIVVQGIAVDNDGSSAPVTYQVLDIRDAVTHKHADSLYKNRDRYVYTSQFDPNVDTTVALLNSIRKNASLPAFDFNTHTGAFTFYNTTENVPLGQYEFDITASNENGTKTFKNIANLNFFDGGPEIDAGGGAWFQDGTTTSGDIGEPKVTITRLSKKGTLAILKIVDENGVAFNPKNGEYIKRGDRNSFDTFAKFHPITVSDTSLTCNFEVIPFPFQQATSNGFTIYYRIPSQFVRIDPGFTPTPAKIYSANPRFTFRLFQEGIYLITVKLQHATRNLN